MEDAVTSSTGTFTPFLAIINLLEPIPAFHFSG